MGKKGTSAAMSHHKELKRREQKRNKERKRQEAERRLAAQAAGTGPLEQERRRVELELEDLEEAGASSAPGAAARAHNLRRRRDELARRCAPLPASLRAACVLREPCARGPQELRRRPRS